MEQTRWRHQMEAFSALLALCEGNSPVTSEFPSQRPVMRRFVFSFICTWITGWVNGHDAGDLGLHRAHNDVIVWNHGIFIWCTTPSLWNISTFKRNFKVFLVSWYFSYFICKLIFTKWSTPCRCNAPWSCSHCVCQTAVEMNLDDIRYYFFSHCHYFCCIHQLLLYVKLWQWIHVISIDTVEINLGIVKMGVWFVNGTPEERNEQLCDTCTFNHVYVVASLAIGQSKSLPQCLVERFANSFMSQLKWRKKIMHTKSTGI